MNHSLTCMRSPLTSTHPRNQQQKQTNKQNKQKNTHHQTTKPKLGCADDLPAAVDAPMLRDDAFLRALHHALLEVALVEGALVCPETGRRFPVKKGIPNMLLHEDEC